MSADKNLKLIGLLFCLSYLKIKSDMYRYMGSFHSLNRIFEGVMYILVVVVGAFFLIKKAIQKNFYNPFVLLNQL